MEIIKSIRICDTYNLSLLKFEGNKKHFYEVQYSDDDKILDYDGQYTNKLEGLLAFNNYLNKVLIKKVN